MGLNLGLNGFLIIIIMHQPFQKLCYISPCYQMPMLLTVKSTINQG